MHHMTPAFFFISLLLFSIANPRVHAQGILVSQYDFLRAFGQLCCTSSGSCPGTPIAGVQVNFTCGNSLFTKVLGQNTTTSDGFFTITAPVPGPAELGFGSTLGLLPICAVFVQVPVSPAACPVLSTGSGSLVGALLSTGDTVNRTQNLRLVAVINTAVLPISISV